MRKSFLKFFIAAAASFTAVSAFADTVTLTPGPQTLRLFGRNTRTFTAFVKIHGTENFQIQVLLQDTLGRNDVSLKTVAFTPVGGRLVQKDKDLYFQTASRMILVAHHEWYYFPAWKPVQGVQLKTAVKQINFNDYVVQVSLNL